MGTNNFISNVVKVNSIELTSYSGLVLNIMEMVVRIDLYESIYDNVLKGSISIIDANGLLESLPIIGEEYVDIDIILPGLDTFQNLKLSKLRIFKITDRVVKNDKIQNYKLWFISNEQIASIETKISKVWYQETTDTIVRDVFSKLNSDKEDTFDIEATKGIQNYVAKNESPFKILNYLASTRSINNSKLSDYVFFESLDNSNSSNSTKFNFKSLSTLCSQQEIATFSYNPLKVRNTINSPMGTNVMPLTAENIEFNKGFDIINSKTSGMYNQTYIYYDILRKSYVVQKTEYDEIFDETKEYKVDGESSSKTFTKNTNTPSEFYNLIYVCGFPSKISSSNEINNVKNSSLNKKANRSSNKWISMYGERNDKVSTLLEETIYRRNVLLQEFENNKVFLKNISGNYNYTIGKTIVFNLPHIRLNKTEAKIDNSDEYDKYQSGKYLITKTHHVIEMEEQTNWTFKTHMEISKNSFKTSIV